jgi:hypothetical protein|tara:strand:- start:257 stop:472 length:216 start_codon:yes stop_codon:yes gene_type:complete
MIPLEDLKLIKVHPMLMVRLESSDKKLMNTSKRIKCSEAKSMVLPESLKWDNPTLEVASLSRMKLTLSTDN